ncbi:MAG TPA: protein kinase [Vicinamibacterales bacterium]|nr:protein kinase [Vicinamibacterales bacterium]
MLPSGTRLGPYEVLGLIGEGGMGQVYRAADTRLDRAVAIKVMPAALAVDPVRRERFEREARSISRLEHPNICPLYDVGALPEESGGGMFLVMQFLEGETLAQRLTRGPLSIKETLDVGIQVAEALAAAHRAGIVHRDLKPGNIMLTRAGARLLDFGLARTVSAGGSVSGATVAGDDRTALTTQGTLLGTLHYMAPEQLDGRDVDTRADIFAFGAVLFEMVTGLKAFEAETPARVLSAILRDEPARVSTIVPVTPAGLDDLIHTCLAKDPNERWQGMGDVARQLRWLQTALSNAKSGATVRPPALPVRSRWLRSWPMAAAIVAALAVGAMLMAAFNRAPAIDPVRLHALLLPPDNNFLTGGIALSPDGRTLAFVATDANGERQLWIRPLDAQRAQPIEGTTGASDPFFSPSGTELAFFANNALKRISISGGSATVICEAGAGAGGTWSRDGVIVFNPHQQGNLMRVSAAGGLPEVATTLDGAANETHHLYPSFLPDGRHYVYYVAGKQRGLYVGEVGSLGRTFLFDPDPALPPGAAATPGVYAASGHLLYVRDRVLMARAFDAGSLRFTGEPIKLADAVDYNPPGQAAFAVAGGVLVYRPRQHLALGSLVWIDRQGEFSEIPASAAAFRQISMAPDGRTAAVERTDAQGVSSVWTIDLEAGMTVRVPAEYWSGAPIWSRDGSSLAYSIAADSPPNVVVRSDRGTGSERRLTRSANIQYAGGFTPDARTVLFRSFSSDTGWDLFTVAADGSSPPQRLLQTPANEIEMSLSPDGRLLAYTSDESGRTEVYVSRFPEMSGRVAVSAGGGYRPLWRSDGRELYFVGPGNRLLAAGITMNGATPAIAPASPVLDVPLFGGLYAPSANGNRFVIAMPAPSTDVVPMELRVNPLAPR